MISQAAIGLIVNAEVTSQAVYEKRYRHPTWPGGASGVTIGIGYDLGMASEAKIVADWQGRVPDAMLAVMRRCAGVHGPAARDLCAQVRALIDIPWGAAMEVFMARDIPEWTARVCRAIPGAETLSPDCLGAIVSVAYNRGASFSTPGDRYREMRSIRAHIAAGELDKVPDDFRSMKRLWAGRADMAGLLVRRDAEAALFEKGLANSGVAVALVPATTLVDADDRKHRIEALQSTLHNEGFDPHGIDGRMGPNTLKAFQRSRGLAMTGELDAATKPLLDRALAEVVPAPVAV